MAADQLRRHDIRYYMLKGRAIAAVMLREHLPYFLALYQVERVDPLVHSLRWQRGER